MQRVCLRTRRFGNKLLKTLDRNYRIVWGDQSCEEGNLYTWDGSGVLKMSSWDDLHAIHDVAHALISSPERLKFAEYGLGPDPGNPSDAKRIVSKEAAQKEEDLVCDLHWTFGAYLYGLDGAEDIRSYLGMKSVPTIDKIEAFAERFKLPRRYLRYAIEAAKASPVT